MSLQSKITKLPGGSDIDTIPSQVNHTVKSKIIEFLFRKKTGVEQYL